MQIPNKNADLYRRLKFYGLGFALGLLAVSMIYKGKGCNMQMPASAKLDELGSQPLVYCFDTTCRVSKSDLTDLIGRIENNAFFQGKGKVNYDLSDVHAGQHAYPTYAVEGLTSSNKNLLLYVSDCDTITKVVKVINYSKAADSCECK